MQFHPQHIQMAHPLFLQVFRLFYSQYCNKRIYFKKASLPFIKYECLLLLHIFPAITFVLILFMFMEIFCLVVHWNCWLKCLRYIVTNINTVSLFKYVLLRRVSNKMLYLDRSGCICLLSCFHCCRELWFWTPTLHHSPHLELEQPFLEALLALWPSPQK